MKTVGVAVRAYGDAGWRDGLLTKVFRACSKAKYQGKRRRTSAQAGTAQFIMGASFGEAAFANMSKGKAYLIFL